MLAVEIDDEPQHAVRGGMVRPEVDGEDVVELVLAGSTWSTVGIGLGIREPS